MVSLISWLNYEINSKIEEWFSNNDLNSELEIFFGKYIPEFWKNLKLLDVIEIAMKSKKAAYTAYNFNHSNFKSFCKGIWETETLDFRDIGKIELKHF